MVDSAPNLGNEPKFADFSNHTDREHNPIDIPDNNPDFRCSDDITMISGSARGLPNSEALCSSRRAAVSSLFGHTRKRETGVCHESSRSSHQENEVELDRESVATTLFYFTVEREKRLRA